MIEVYFVCL